MNRRTERKEKKAFGFKGRASKRKNKKNDVLMAARFRKKKCRMCEEKIEFLDYKDLKRLERMVSERGKILSRRITGACARHQRKVVDAVKKARFIALLPFLRK